MAEQSDGSAAALQAHQTAVATRECAAEAADQMLADTLREARTATVTARQRVDAIAADIDCIANEVALGGDSPLGARELQKRLIAKQRELIMIVSEARWDAAAKQAVLEALSGQYVTTT